MWAGDASIILSSNSFRHSVFAGGLVQVVHSSVFMSALVLPKQLMNLSLTIIYLQVLLQAVLPFDLLLDRKKRIDFFNKLVENSNLETKPKVVRDAAFALGSLVVCEEALERELFISTSYVLLINQCNTSGIKERSHDLL